jgi:hypothetical protein
MNLYVFELVAIPPAESDPHLESEEKQGYPPF